MKSRSAEISGPKRNDPASEVRTISGDSNASWTILFLLTLIVPVLVLPRFLENAFNTPKNTLIIIGISALLGIYLLKYLKGKPIPVPRTGTNFILILLILLNIFSFFYTNNYFYTCAAASINIICLLSFYFVSIYVYGNKAWWLLIAAAFAGFLVSFETWLQFFNVFLLFPWAHPGINVIGTIGNSNHLGAYLLFVLFISLGLFFVVERHYRSIPAGLFIFVFAAFVFSRARASWLGFFVAFPVFLLLLKRIFNFSAGKYLGSRPKQVVIHALAAIVFLSILWWIAPQRLHEMMKWDQVGQSLTLKLRTEKYSRASLWLFKQNPFFGTGLWSFRNMVYDAQAEINKSDPEFFGNYPEPKPRRVHNEYLETLNDGGLLAAVALVLFLASIMSHGWKVIRNEAIDKRDRIISATAFCSIIAILTAAVFFFPFRINSTLFMTALMLGLMEGLYLRNYELLTTSRISISPGLRIFFTPVLVLLLGGLVWFTATKPFMGEIEHFKYGKALAAGKPKEAEIHLLKALEYDPYNTLYCTQAGQFYMGPFQDVGKAGDFFERAIVNFNGDITLYSLLYLKGLVKFQIGSLFEARDAFQKALYYYPDYQEASQKLEEIKRIIKDHDQVLIKFR